MIVELERFIAKREFLDNLTRARVSARKSDNFLFEFAFGDELLHHVGNCLLYCRASTNCDPAQRSQHFLIEVVDRPIANPKCDSVLRESFHVIPSALLSHPQETFGEQFCDVRVTQSILGLFPGLSRHSHGESKWPTLAVASQVRITCADNFDREKGHSRACVSPLNHIITIQQNSPLSADVLERGFTLVGETHSRELDV